MRSVWAHKLAAGEARRSTSRVRLLTRQPDARPRSPLAAVAVSVNTQERDAVGEAAEVTAGMAGGSGGSSPRADMAGGSHTRAGAAGASHGGVSGHKKAHQVPVALSTASVFPERTADAFELAARIGYDGIEVMVTADPVSQDAAVLRRLSEYHGVPVLAIHSPCLLITQRVWGREPWGKLEKSAEAAHEVGAKVVVVHPPFRWQRDYVREFESGLAKVESRTGMTFAVENLYPLRPGGTELAAYAPHWNPVELDVSQVTLDLSHTAVSDSDAIDMARRLGPRLAHIHLTDGTKPGLPDEHLVPGRGSQPCRELLELLPSVSFNGVVVVEISTRRALDAKERYADLAESLRFAKAHLPSAKAGH
jgi:sugar phosphate isomerase/epimerase